MTGFSPWHWPAEPLATSELDELGHLATMDWAGHEAVNRANANAIAAAPDLWEALAISRDAM